MPRSRWGIPFRGEIISKEDEHLYIPKAPKPWERIFIILIFLLFFGFAGYGLLKSLITTGDSTAIGILIFAACMLVFIVLAIKDGYSRFHLNNHKEDDED